MEWNLLLYEATALAKEEQLHSWEKGEAAARGIRCVTWSGELSQQTIDGICARYDAAPESLLVIVTKKQEWELVRQLNAAALPYAPAGTQDTVFFEGAWIVVEGFEEVDYDFLLKCYERAHDLPWEILRTKRCHLRELTLSDLDDLFLLYGKPGVTKYMEGLYERSEEENYQRAYIANMYRYYGYGMWLVCTNDDDRVIGRAGLEHREYHGQFELEMGYLIAPEEQHKGYATEVCRAILKYARTNLDFPSVNCLIQTENTASKNLAGKLGFTLLEKMTEDGQEMDRYIYCF